ncbi:MAG: phage holin [Clostridia bacterium]|nr:phage holin [Clostridia bacterium]
MKLKDRIKTVGFWAGLVGAVILILGAFGVEISDETANTVVNAVCSLLVVFGIVSSPKQTRDDEQPQSDEQPHSGEDEENMM